MMSQRRVRNAPAIPTWAPPMRPVDDWPYVLHATTVTSLPDSIRSDFEAPPAPTMYYTYGPPAAQRVDDLWVGPDSEVSRWNGQEWVPQSGHWDEVVQFGTGIVRRDFVPEREVITVHQHTP